MGMKAYERKMMNMSFELVSFLVLVFSYKNLMKESSWKPLPLLVQQFVHFLPQNLALLLEQEYLD
jgi:hypothetical protein